MYGLEKSLLLLMLIPPSCSEVDGQNDQVKNVTSESCEMVVQQYVEQTRGWKRKSYRISQEPAIEGSYGFEVWHESDNVVRPPGGGETGKSFHVDLDAKCTKVLSEFAYQ